MQKILLMSNNCVRRKYHCDMLDSFLRTKLPYLSIKVIAKSCFKQYIRKIANNSDNNYFLIIHLKQGNEATKMQEV